MQFLHGTYSQPSLPDDHSKVVPLLPIPNRTVKRLSADDSVHSHVKVGHRQALQFLENPALQKRRGFLFNQLTFSCSFSRTDPFGLGLYGISADM